MFQRVESRLGVFWPSAAIAALMFLPFLGSVGLWDPWETQYAEVARQMLVRGDWIHPYWESNWFFSKPILTMWMMMPGLWLTGAAENAGELSRYTEWGVRLPFALFAVFAVADFSKSIGLATTPNKGRLTALVLSTMPLFFFVSRQAMTDMSYVAPFVLCLSAVIRAQFVSDNSINTQKFWRVACAWAGVATLGKGMLGFALPGLIMGVYWAFEWRTSKQTLKNIPWLSGILIWAAIAVPWYLAMFVFEGHDIEGLTFFQRFILRDHFARLGQGVHSTTPGGTFVYFIEQLGFGIFPWVALLPAALATAMHVKTPVTRFLSVWAFVSFSLFTASATRFHHYVLPSLPAFAALIALSRPRWMSLLAGALALGLVAKDLLTHPKHWVDLFTYNQQRAYPDFLWTSGYTLFFGALCAATVLAWKRVSPKVSVSVLALVVGIWLSHFHWVALGQHWTQKELFDRYHHQASPGEPIAAFWMDWKGETFYSRNQVVQIKPGREPEALAMAQKPGRAWFLVEHYRFEALQRALGKSQRLVPVEPNLNNKFILVAAHDIAEQSALSESHY